MYNEDTAQKIRKEYNLGESFVVGHVGRLFAPKNHMYLLEIFKEFLKRKPDSLLMLVGDGPMRKEIENRIEELGLKEKVIMTGVVNNVHEVLQAMDCFVFPSLYEGVPLTVIEAQAAGIPCFISDRITGETCVTDLAHSLSIDLEPDKWCDEILKAAPVKIRKNTTELIAKSGYDVYDNARWITDFYINCIK